AARVPIRGFPAAEPDSFSSLRCSARACLGAVRHSRDAALDKLGARPASPIRRPVQPTRLLVQTAGHWPMTSTEAARQLISRPMTEYASAIGVSFASIPIIVASDDAQVINETAHYLPKATTCGEGASYEITYDADLGFSKEVAESCLAHGSPIHAKRDMRYLAQIDRDILMMASDFGVAGSRHLILCRGRRFAVVAIDNAEGTRPTPIRIGREILLRELENRGGVFAHAAAAVLKDGRGVLILGERASGKTSTMCRLVTELGADYLSNDRSIIRAEQDRLVCYGWPLAIRLGAGFLKEGSLAATYFRLKPHRSQTDAVRQAFASDVCDAWGCPDKLELTPKE